MIAFLVTFEDGDQVEITASHERDVWEEFIGDDVVSVECLGIVDPE